MNVPYQLYLCFIFVLFFLFFTGVWLTESLLRSPGHVSAFWPTSTTLYFRWFDFQVIQTPYQAFGNRSKCTNYNWYHRHFHLPQFPLFSGKVQVYAYLFCFFFYFLFAVQCDSWECKSAILRLLFFLNYRKVWLSGQDENLREWFIIFIILILESFYISVSWWSFTGI